SLRKACISRSGHRTLSLFAPYPRRIRRMNIETKAAELLHQAEALAQSVESWADLSNALFDPLEGGVARAFPTRAERRPVAQTPEYGKIGEVMDEAGDRFGLVAGATPKRSGRMVLQVPLALQGALEREARAEGVSVDQLVIAKLAAQLSDLVAK